jgi:hypothetical protein
MLQFVSHSAQQIRHAEGFEGLVPEEFRDIKTFFSTPTPEIAITLVLRNSRVRARACPAHSSCGMTMSVMTSPSASGDTAQALKTCGPATIPLSSRASGGSTRMSRRHDDQNRRHGKKKKVPPSITIDCLSAATKASG